MGKGECMPRNDVMVSDRNCFRMIVQDDGNMVVYRQRDNHAVWSSETRGRDGAEACMQRKTF